jgi:cob(I)alamin adenosyltransferase
VSTKPDEGGQLPGHRPRRRGRRGGRGRRRSGQGAGRPVAAVGPRIYTRTGDLGETGLIGGKRVPKDDPRVEAYGAVDELNASIGAARALTRETDLIEVFERIQHRLFDLGAELAAPKPGAETPSAVTEAEVKVLEGVIDLYQETLPPLREFILPAGSPLGAALQVARTVCRRAERRAVTLARREAVNPEIVRYLNRLSDLLFVLARVGNERAGTADIPWKKAAPPPVTAAGAPSRGRGTKPPSRPA